MVTIKQKVITSGAVTSNVDLSNYYTKEEVDTLIPTDFLKEIPAEYITESELNGKGYVNGYQLMSSYYNKSEVDSKIDSVGNFDDTNYYTKSDIDNKGYLTEHQSLDDYYKRRDINNILSVSKFEFVDLGLPSGLKWATCNIGAASPEEYGLYFAWGETQGYSMDDITNGARAFSWEEYKWCNGTSGTLTKYNVDSRNGIVDNLTELQPEDDVASVTDNSCRMPTRNDLAELKNNTTFTWEKLNGVSGGRFTAPNGKSIFIPASGSYEDGKFGANPNYTGYICASTTETQGVPKYPTRASAMRVQSNGVQFTYLSRPEGFPIRAVQEADSVTLFSPKDYYTKTDIDSKIEDIYAILDSLKG